MKLIDYLISPTDNSYYKGQITVDENFSYEVYGPFGQGYNIRLTGPSGEADLNYHWRDGPGASVKTPYGKYEMSDKSVFKQGKKLLQLSSKGNFEAIDDNFAMALFILNHHYWNRSGPFQK